MNIVLNINNKNVIKNKLSSPFSNDKMKDFILNNMDAKHSNTQIVNNKKGVVSTPIDIDEDHLSSAQLIEHQKQQLEKLERDEYGKKKQVEDEEKKKIQVLKEKAELEKKLKEEQENKTKMLPDEPSSSEVNSTLIIFRYPHSEQRRERRFMKSDKVSTLYLFIESLGADMFEESNDFELITPFPMKIYNNKEATLEEEKLFPNAVLQIREI